MSLIVVAWSELLLFLLRSLNQEENQNKNGESHRDEFRRQSWADDEDSAGNSIVLIFEIDGFLF